ncbi:MAG: ADP-forming succinate--CoA ligase subunit beta [Acidobacteria bacterium]|nr:ADP-forming succinate--CoA ligase subunit beta [Acidobacteriota bacterium]
MKIHEFQAKAIFARFGVPVPHGEVAASANDARDIAKRLSGRVVVKAQIHAGGRGKGGGVKLAASPDEAESIAKTMLGMTLVTHQTGPLGRVVKRVLVEEAVEIQKEYYVSLVVDRAAARNVIMASTEGGMDIEDVAAKTPDKILKAWIDPAAGFQPFVARKIAFGLGLTGPLVGKFGALLASLYKAFEGTDASLAEINPLLLTKGGDFLALDGKMTFDDNALYRHPDIKEMRDLNEEDPLEVEASKFSINYIKLDGTVGCMVNGAGLAMATMDIIKLAGGSPANFLDVGGGASAQQVENAFRIILSDRNVKAVLINIFGGIMRCDVVAQGVVEAVKKIHVAVPIVVRLEGTNSKEGGKILRESGLNFTVADGMKDAAAKVVAATSGRAA